ncbi:MAG: class I SAM-dependent methyltransferase [Candidatus Algichlamydia australiensis]|nr:class I SAM-dependent methyltransferase [Chlamydiales bacterium]
MAFPVNQGRSFGGFNTGPLRQTNAYLDIFETAREGENWALIGPGYMRSVSSGETPYFPRSPQVVELAKLGAMKKISHLDVYDSAPELFSILRQPGQVSSGNFRIGIRKMLELNECDEKLTEFFNKFAQAITAEKSEPEIEFLTHDFAKLDRDNPPLQKRYDVVFATFVLTSSSYLFPLMLSNFVRILKPGGRLYIENVRQDLIEVGLDWSNKILTKERCEEKNTHLFKVHKATLPILMKCKPNSQIPASESGCERLMFICSRGRENSTGATITTTEIAKISLSFTPELSVRNREFTFNDEEYWFKRAKENKKLGKNIKKSLKKKSEGGLKFSPLDSLHGMTPLHVAVLSNNLAMLRFFSRFVEKAEWDRPDRFEMSPRDYLTVPHHDNEWLKTSETEINTVINNFRDSKN